MLRVCTFRTRRKTLPARYARAYKRARNFLRPEYDGQMTNIKKSGE